MTGDICRAIAGKVPRKPDKRKKKRAKKKPAVTQAIESGSASIKSPVEDIEAVFPPENPVPEVPESLIEKLPETPVNKGNISPRKQTLMRHKSSRESVAEPSFVSEVKQIKKNRKVTPVADSVDGKYSFMLAHQPMDGKAALFFAPSARIVSYHESVHGSPLRASPGTLLAHGEFEIFQLHGGDVTYLACGQSFVYPLLPKLKILRTSSCEFVLPLVNPQRYWKIHIDASDKTVFHDLETVLQKVVRYTNLAPTEPPDNDIVVSLPSPRAGHVDDSTTEIKTKIKTKTKAPETDPYTPYFNDIPESPPSISASPNARHAYNDYNDLGTPSSPGMPLSSPWEGPVQQQQQQQQQHKSIHTITYGMANLSVPGLLHPRPHALANPFYHDSSDTRHVAYPDPDSDSSSMDSLLDEYEETISVTKSAHQQFSRPASRTASHISARPSGSHLHSGRPDVPGSHYEIEGQPLPLYRRSPAAAYPRYAKPRKTSVGARSRRSSISELYSATSNWMEPGHAPHAAAAPKLSSSRSTYSLAAPRESYGKSNNLNETYREIYRSITSHNLASITANDMQFAATAPVPSKSKGMDVSQKPVAASAGIAEAYSGKHPLNMHRNIDSSSPRPDRLSSNEVFKLLSEREHHKQQQQVQPPATGLRKLFGW